MAASTAAVTVRPMHWPQDDWFRWLGDLRRRLPAGATATVTVQNIRPGQSIRDHGVVAGSRPGRAGQLHAGAAAMTNASTSARNIVRSRGMTLIELMVAMTIGLFLTWGAFQVYIQSKSNYRAAEVMTRLQENARFALETLEPGSAARRVLGTPSRARADGGPCRHRRHLRRRERNRLGAGLRRAGGGRGRQL